MSKLENKACHRLLVNYFLILRRIELVTTF